MGDQIRVVFFHIGSDTFGGGSKMLLRLLQSLDQDQFDPILLSNTSDELCTRARNHGIEVKITAFRGALDTYNRKLLANSSLLPRAGLRILQFNWNAYSILRSADIIWCKNLRAVLTLLPYISLTHTPTIWNIGLGLESNGKVQYLNSIALRAVDHVFIESEEQAQRIFSESQYERYRDQFTVFHKGIDTSEFDPKLFASTRDEEEFRIGTAASISPRKGLEYLIDALPPILAEKETVTLLIAGKPPNGCEGYKERLNDRIHQHNIDDHVEFLGWIDDMPKFLSTLDVFVLPSLNEGIPGAVREALAMEVPVVATDVGGTSNVVIDGQNGYLIGAKDAKAITNPVLSLLNNPRTRSSMGERGREIIQERFSIENYNSRYEKFFRSINENSG